MMPRFPYSFGRVVQEIQTGLYLSSSKRLRRQRHPIRSTWLLVRMLVRAVLTAIEEWRQLQHDCPYPHKGAQVD